MICSGSLLGINYKKIHSNSVGYKTDYEMFSMDFEEFLWAKGYTEIHIDNLLKHMQDGVPFSDTELAVYKSCFWTSMCSRWDAGCCQKYIETGTFSETLEIKDRSSWIMRKISGNTQRVWIRLKL